MICADSSAEKRGREAAVALVSFASPELRPHSEEAGQVTPPHSLIPMGAELYSLLQQKAYQPTSSAKRRCLTDGRDTCSLMDYQAVGSSSLDSGCVTMDVTSSASEDDAGQMTPMTQHWSTPVAPLDHSSVSVVPAATPLRQPHPQRLVQTSATSAGAGASTSSSVPGLDGLLLATQDLKREGGGVGLRDQIQDARLLTATCVSLAACGVLRALERVFEQSSLLYHRATRLLLEECAHIHSLDAGSFARLCQILSLPFKVGAAWHASVDALMRHFAKLKHADRGVATTAAATQVGSSTCVAAASSAFHGAINANTLYSSAVHRFGRQTVWCMVTLLRRILREAPWPAGAPERRARQSPPRRSCPCAPTRAHARIGRSPCSGRAAVTHAPRPARVPQASASSLPQRLRPGWPRSPSASSAARTCQRSTRRRSWSRRRRRRALDTDAARLERRARAPARPILPSLRAGASEVPVGAAPATSSFSTYVFACSNAPNAPPVVGRAPTCHVAWHA